MLFTFAVIVGLACLRSQGSELTQHKLHKFWLAGWLAGWLVGWLVGWLAGWLAG